jgi:hypothetical protein
MGLKHPPGGLKLFLLNDHQEPCLAMGGCNFALPLVMPEPTGLSEVILRARKKIWPARNEKNSLYRTIREK